MGVFSWLVEEAVNVVQEGRTISNSIENAQKWKEYAGQTRIEREKFYNNWLAQEMDAYNTKKYISQIESVLIPILRDRPVGDRNFSKLEQFPPELKNIEYYKQNVDTLPDKYYKMLVEAYYNGTLSTRNLIWKMHDMITFDDWVDRVKPSLTATGYYETFGFTSVLTDIDNVESELDKIKKEFNEESIMNSDEYNYLVRLADAKAAYSDGDYKRAFDLLASAGKSDEWINTAKRMLLCSAMSVDTDIVSVTTFDTIMRVNGEMFKCVFPTGEGENIKYETIETVDMILARTIKYSRAGITDNVNFYLKQFLDLCAEWCKQDMFIRTFISEQYNVLCKVFAYLEAYNQEAMVLESMVLNNVPRSADQEKRLHFLRSGQHNSSTPKKISYNVNKGEMAYEYRCLKWSANEVKGFFDELSSLKQSANVPMAADEWTTELELNGLKFDIEALKEQLNECLNRNFGNRYKMSVISAGAIVEGYLEFAPSIYVEDTQNYPWIGFLITGESLILSRLTLSVYTLYVPEKDTYNREDIIQFNTQCAAKYSMLLQKQNPKINSYISTVKNVFLNETEKWLNGSENGNMYN